MRIRDKTKVKDKRTRDKTNVKNMMGGLQHPSYFALFSQVSIFTSRPALKQPILPNGSAMKETSRRRITVTSSFNY